MNDLEKLFTSELKDIYDAEHRLVEALGEMEKSASSQELKMAFHEHQEQTRTHVNRLEQVFRELGEEPDRKKCKAIQGIIDEGELIAREFSGNTALDAALITAGQKAEHYEITSYGSLCTWAKELGHNGVLALLKENMSEEKNADARLSLIAKTSRNADARFGDTKKKSEAGAMFSKVIGH